VNGHHHPVINGNPKRPPRRMRSFSDALDLIGNSFHNIYDKHAQKKKNKTMSQSTVNLPNAVDQEMDELAAKKHRSKSLKGRRSASQEKEMTTTPGPCPPSSPEREIRHRRVHSAETNIHPKPSRSRRESTEPKSGSSSPPRSRVTKEKEDQHDTDTEHTAPSCLSTAPKGAEARRASIRFVDFLTEDGIQTEDGDENGNDCEETDEDELQDEPGSLHNGPRKTWFPLAFEPTSEQEEEEDLDEEDDVVPERHSPKAQINGDFESPANNFYRRMRKDSIAISIKSARSLRSMRATPEP